MYLTIILMFILYYENLNEILILQRPIIPPITNNNTAGNQSFHARPLLSYSFPNNNM